MDRKPVPPPKTNRIPMYLAQIQDYWFRAPQKRFAQDAGIPPWLFSRILRGKISPRYADICKIVAHFERKLQRKIDPREIYEP